MVLTNKQLGVLKGMVSGLLVSICIVALGSYINPFGYADTLAPVFKFNIAIVCSLIPAFFLAISIGRLARHRFLTPEDIDGSALSNGTSQSKLLQSLLQNTLEQAVLATLVYCAWAVVMPATWLSAVPIAAIAFGVGRILFFAAYARGAQARAIGFTLSFYPSLIMLLTTIGVLLWRQVS